MKLGTQKVCGLSRILCQSSGTGITGAKICCILALYLFYFSAFLSCIALQSNSNSLTSFIIPPLKTNLLKKICEQVETMEKLTM